MHPSGENRPYYVRRGKQIGRLQKERLLHAWKQGQILDDDEIRRSGSTQWFRACEFNWESLKSVESHQEALAGDVRDEEPNVAIQQTSELAQNWWRDTSQDRMASRQRTLSRWLLPVGIIGLAMCIVASYLLPGFYPKPTKLQEGGSAATAAAPTANSVSTTQAEDMQNVPLQLNEVTSEPPQSITLEPPVADLFEPVPASTKDSSANLASLPQAVPAGESPVADPTAILAQANVTQVSVDGDRAKPSDFNQQNLGDRAYDSASVRLASKSVVDLLFDRTAAVINFHLRTTRELREHQREWMELTKSIVELDSYIVEANILLRTGPEQLNALEVLHAQYTAELSRGVDGREHLIDKRIQCVQQGKILAAKLNQVTQRFQVTNTELFAKKEKRKVIQTEITRLAGLEVESMRKLMDHIDFFGELPDEYHRRLHIAASTAVASNPDFLLGYVLRGCSSAYLHHGVEVVEQDSQDLIRQLSAIPADIRSLRNQLLTRYRSIALCLIVIAKLEEGSADAAMNELNGLKQMEPGFAEGWLLRGIAIAQVGTAADARDAFQRAIRMLPDDARVYRVALRHLRKAGGTSNRLMHSYISALTERASTLDSNSWMEICLSLLAVDDVATAKAHFHNLKRSPLNEDDYDNLARQLGFDSATE